MAQPDPEHDQEDRGRLPLQLEQARRRAGELEQRVAERTTELRLVEERLAQEIAERRRAEAALREIERKYGPAVEIQIDRCSEEEAIAEERQRLAREIHDGLAQDLAALRLRIRACQALLDRDPAQLRAELDRAHEILAHSLQDVRRSIRALRPAALDELGFFAAVERLVADFGDYRQGQVNLYLSGEPDQLPPALEPALFRMIQEALNNVAKHARARTVVVHLDLLAPGRVVLHIEDDGDGFDPAFLEEAVRGGHFGLKQMHERVAELNGTFILNSRPGAGTEIEIRLPRPERE